MGKSEMKKLKYEVPVIVDLGEMARGSGVPTCETGASNYSSCNPSGSAAYVNCIIGNNKDGTSCLAGPSA